MLQDVFALFIYMLALVVTFLLLAGLPVVLFAQGLDFRRTCRNGVLSLVPLLVGAACLIGGVGGWLLLPSQWTMFIPADV